MRSVRLYDEGLSRRLIMMVVCFIFVLLPACSQADSPKEEAKIPPLKIESLVIQKQDGTSVSLNVEMAVTRQEQAQGLMWRESLADDAGMLFVFEDIAPRYFWMKNTLIPLDMLFVDKDGSIHHIHHNAVPGDARNISSGAPAKAVLEIAGGASDRLGLNAGDKVIHSVFE